MKHRWLRLVLSLALLASLVPVGPVAQAAQHCSVDYSPAVISPGRQKNFSFTVHNDTAVTLNWLQIVPPVDLTPLSGTAAGFTADVSDGTATFTQGALAGGASLLFTVRALAGANEGTESWAVSVSDSNDFGLSCGGNMDVTIASQPDDLMISNVSVSNMAPNQATIGWSTNKPADSQVAYGPDNNYGNMSTLNPSLVTSHSVTLPGLTANTGYHFAVTSATPANGDMVTSGDNTFLTQPVPAAGGTVPPVVNASAKKAPTPRGAVPIAATPKEAVPPVVAVTTSLAKPFAKDPVVAGTARDNIAVAGMDYSVDGGKSWVVVPSPPGLGTKLVNFVVTAAGLEDGNYSFVVRATDTSGNTATTPPVTLVVDREPPRIGAELVTFGPQAAVQDAGGRWLAAVGVDQTVTMNAVGGPVGVTLAATRAGAVRAVQSFYLRQDTENGLWSGLLSFNSAGVYHLTAEAVDGAGNRLSRALSDVVVSAPARVVEGQSGRSVSGAKVTLYYRQATSGQWAAWDGAAYGQSNPQTTSAGGTFDLLAPAGVYYLEAKAPGYQTLVTRQFTLTRPTPLVPVLGLMRRPRLKLGNWSWALPGVTLSQTAVNPADGAGGATPAIPALVGRSLPAFRLPTTVGSTVTPDSLHGKPTVVTVLSTWAPPSAEQLPALAAVAGRGGVNVVPVYMGERAGQVEASLARAGYHLAAAVDVHALLGDQWGVPNLPTHFFVDRSGKVVSVQAGVLPADELWARLSRL